MSPFGPMASRGCGKAPPRGHSTWVARIVPCYDTSHAAASTFCLSASGKAGASDGKQPYSWRDARPYSGTIWGYIRLFSSSFRFVGEAAGKLRLTPLMSLARSCRVNLLHVSQYSEPLRIYTPPSYNEFIVRRDV
jgi:hypothetical protein